jgi:hypothetical protein
MGFIVPGNSATNLNLHTEEKVGGTFLYSRWNNLVFTVGAMWLLTILALLTTPKTVIYGL